MSAAYILRCSKKGFIRCGHDFIVVIITIQDEQDPSHAILDELCIVLTYFSGTYAGILVPLSWTTKFVLVQPFSWLKRDSSSKVDTYARKIKPHLSALKSTQIQIPQHDDINDLPYQQDHVLEYCHVFDRHYGE